MRCIERREDGWVGEDGSMMLGGAMEGIVTLGYVAGS